MEKVGVETRASGRLWLWGTLAAGGIGILFALFQVQGWKVPTPLAVALIVLLLAVIAVAVSMMAFEISRAARRLLEHRATTPSWVSADPPGLLDYEADSIRAQSRFTRELAKQARDTEKLGRTINRHSDRMNRLKSKSARRRQRLANRSAKSINRSAVFVEKRVALLKALVKDIERNYRGFIANLIIESDEDFQAARTLRDVLDGGREVTVESMGSVVQYRESVAALEASNPSRTLRIAAGRLEKALAGVVTMMRNHEKATASLVREFDAKLDGWRRQ